MRSSVARIVTVAVAAVFGTALALTGASVALADDATHAAGSTVVASTTEDTWPWTSPADAAADDDTWPWTSSTDASANADTWPWT
ncbi:hypothetical protein [Actinoplanes siamensis]|uniref:Uncharacterized protein n=1 Tax=Actinoplanes siamensis TaxID=1223317 RepID=A0A919NDX2_9ACTN|nr:hypothetical protein [Actinoplanes siamensis]GIF09462.1 hypothetical protein Asi03nite_70000 [Actinoplanes siamensis]